MDMDKKGKWRKRGKVAAVVLIMVLAIALVVLAISNSNVGGAVPNQPFYAPPYIVPPGGFGDANCAMYKILADNNIEQQALPDTPNYDPVTLGEWASGNYFCAGAADCSWSGIFPDIDLDTILHELCIPRRISCAEDDGLQSDGGCVKCNCKDCF